jgi:hypothetical protein
VGVGVGHRLADLLEDGHEAPTFVRRVGPLGQQLVQVASADQFHGQEGPAVGQDAQVVDRWDGGMLQLPGDARLILETTHHLGGQLDLLLELLERHLAAEPGVEGAIDDAHAAVGNLLAQFVPIR